MQFGYQSAATALLAAAFAGGLLAGCMTTDGPRDSMGRPMEIGAPQELTVDKADLNVGALIDPRHVTKVERRMRDRELIIEKYTLKGIEMPGSGQIVSERVPEGWYSQSTANDMGNLDGFRARVEKLLADIGYVGQSPAVKLENQRARATIGYRTVATVQQDKGQCFFSRAAYRLGMRTMYDNDWEAPDTVVEIVYCDAAGRGFASFEALAANLQMMRPEDAAAIQKKLAGR